MAGWKLKFANFEYYLKLLKQAAERVNKEKEDQLLLAGHIKTFEMTFELAWKTLKSYLEHQGFSELNSPRIVLRTAFENNFISQGDLWLKCLDSRNLSSHTYDQSASLKWAETIKAHYLPLLDSLYATLNKVYLNETK